MNFVFKKFEELTTRELYAIIQLRVAVFVVEQDCPYQDVDDVDFQSEHVMMYDDNGRLVGYTRLIPKYVKYNNAAAIGRVVTHLDIRRKGYGKILMEQSIDRCRLMYPGEDIRISAQLYLKEFYGGLGFIQQSDTYLEDNIPHIEMLLEQ